jgi:hypothetical protein
MLPAYRVNPMLDLSPISNALTGYQQQMNTNDQLDMQQKRLDMEQTKFNDERIAKVEQELGNLGYLHLTNPGKYDSKWAGAVQELVAKGQKINPNFAVPQEYFDPKVGAHVAISKAGMVPQYLDWQLRKSSEGRAAAAEGRAAEDHSVRRSQVEGMTADERRKLAPALGMTDPTQIEQFARRYDPKDTVTTSEGQTIHQRTRNPDGTVSYRPILSGVEKPPPEHTAKAASFASRMVEAERNIRGLLSGIDPISGSEVPKFGASDKSVAVTNPLPEVARNMVISSEHQRYRQAAEQWIRAFLRKESGAAIGKDEFTRDFVVYFPQPGDGPEVQKQKEEARASVMHGMAAESGSYMSRIAPEAAKHLQLYKPSTPSSGPVRVNSIQEAMRLAPGTQFITPDGRIKVR